MKLTKNQLVEWAIKNIGATMYMSADDFRPEPDWAGSEDGPNGGVIHLIAQADSGCIYGETTDDFNAASFLVVECAVMDSGTVYRAVVEILDMALGGQDGWPDNYAQTKGWRL